MLSSGACSLSACIAVTHSQRTVSARKTECAHYESVNAHVIVMKTSQDVKSVTLVTMKKNKLMQSVNLFRRNGQFFC